jgi:hypothetical protein
MINFGPVPSGAVLPIMFTTYGKTNGESITLTGLAVTDVEVYKGTSVTQRSSDAGYALIDTDGIDIDSITGLHGFSIDTGDDTDAGFYSVGSYFTVVVSAVTIDGQTVNFIAATFRIVAAEGVTGKPKVDVDAWLGTAAATPTVAGVPEVDVTHFNGSAGTFASGRPEVNTSHIAGSAVSTSSAQIGVNVVNAGGTAWASGSLTSGVFASGAITATAIAADAIGASELAADAIAEIADAVWDEDATAHQTQGTFGQGIGDPAADTDTIYALANSIKADTAAILADTGTDGVIVASIATNAINAAAIADGAIDSGAFAAGAITASAIAADAIGASELAADAIAEIADAVWDVDATGHQTGGTFGQAIGDPGADTTTMYAAVVTGAAGTHIAADIVALKAETADILVDTAEIGAAGAGLTNINLPNQTMDIVGNITGNLSGSVGSVTGAVGSVTGAVGSVTGNVGGNVTGSVGSLATQAKADVNTEVLDVLSVDTFAEPGQGTPAATNTLSVKVGYLFKAWRNRTTVTSSEYALYADDATTKDQEAALSDNGTTFERGEVATGA